MNREPAILVAAVVLAAAGVTASERWPQFRGENAAGVSREATAPEKWSPTENVAWVVDVPGSGWSSPVVWDDTVYLTSAVSPGAFKEPSSGIYGNDYIAELRAQGVADEEVTRLVRERDNESSEEVGGQVRWMLYALDAATGKTRFEVEVHRGEPFRGRHRKNTYASETPAVDGARIYVLLGNVGVFAHGFDGKPLWSWRMPAQPSYLDFGTSSSPVVHDGRVFVLHDNQEESFLFGLDAKTGRELWHTRRDFGEAFMRSSFATPFVWKNSRRTELVTVGPKTVISYDLDGKELWRFTGMSMVGAPTPVADGDVLFVGSGSPSENVRPLVAFRAGASGDVSLKGGATTSDIVAWYQERGGSYITSPLFYGSRVYVLYDQGFFGAFDAKTGKALYKGRFPEGSPTFSASPWAHGGKVFCLSEEGETFVVLAGDEFKLAGRNGLAELSFATPALAHESLFLRTARKLYRFKS
jgi:outer membrane protein assembly factor BamB